MNQHKKDNKLSSQENLDNLNPTGIQKIKKFRNREISGAQLAEKITKGNKIALSQGITLIESNHAKHQKDMEELLAACLPYSGNSLRIGITGVPGVGKSTFIETFGNYLVGLGKKIAVLAVDPTSSISQGSILGDKTRMDELVKQENAFIRPSPSGGSLGGVSRKTRESIMLCEAAGFDIILIETVGVGQSETTVHGMTDFFLLLKLAGAGDELQGIKRGIMEMADAIVINKADGENQKAAKHAKTEFRRALHLYPPKKSGWHPKVSLCSALKNTGIAEIWKMIEDFQNEVKANGYFGKNRNEQNRFWVLQTIEEQLKQNFYQNPEVKKILEEQLKAVENKETTPFLAAKYLLNLK
ncbi:MAG TPA: methylmalonyl Co-A mutase-associated GTPase MeaB [Flavobacteriaceae bacterium]|nr:methylmalonyl Co-A mutase-associated GTPase MeaB [Flavobacteriaceae bacterium]